ncbi:MAG: hypothetical protein KGI27_13865 [Thaumarchaeota archaeon]|nr:hypothetical protein [Nitrososphaerota archaeon]
MQDQSRKAAAKMSLDSLRQELTLVTAELQKTLNEIAATNSELESIEYNHNMTVSLQNEVQSLRAEISNMQNIRIKFESDMQLLRSKISLVSTEIFKARDEFHNIEMETESLRSQLRSLDIHQDDSAGFLLKYKKYFQNHTLANLPELNICSIDVMKTCEFVEGAIQVLNKWESMINNSGKYLKLIVAKYPLESISLVASKVMDGVMMSYIFGSNTLIPHGRSEMLKKVDWDNKISMGIVERRWTDTVPVMLLVTENEAAISFMDFDGNVDVNSTFYGKDHLFHNWCLDLFTYAWTRSIPFDEDKVKETVYYNIKNLQCYSYDDEFRKNNR